VAIIGLTVNPGQIMEINNNSFFVDEFQANVT